jgi:hypothetical protein
VIKSRKLKWARHTAYMRQMKNAHKVWVGKFEGDRQPKDLGIYGRTI